MKILILSFFLLPFSFLFSQGNLQFNQVLRKEISVPSLAAYSSSSISLTVPVGKTWKIESASVYSYSSTTNPEYTWSGGEIRLGGFLLNTVYRSGLGFYPSNLPIWLPAGSYNLTIQNPSSGAMMQQTIGIVSIIEFNIIP